MGGGSASALKNDFEKMINTFHKYVAGLSMRGKMTPGTWVNPSLTVLVAQFR